MVNQENTSGLEELRALESQAPEITLRLDASRASWVTSNDGPLPLRFCCETRYRAAEGC